MNPAVLSVTAMLVGLQASGADGLGGPLTQNLSHRFIDPMVTVLGGRGFTGRRQSCVHLASELG